MGKQKAYINREISWLYFNERVMQEATDPVNPLIERIKFLGIFSSNLDEYFRVRVATVKRMISAGNKARMLFGEDPNEILNEIQQIVINQGNTFDAVYDAILNELEKERIFIINERQLSPEQVVYVHDYFRKQVQPSLFPVMVGKHTQFPVLKDHSIYLAVCMKKNEKEETCQYALIEIPSRDISRFLVLPPQGRNTYIILLDDVIRVGLKDIFSMFNYSVYHAYTIKLTRDAELTIDDDIRLSFFEKMSKSLKQRKKGEPVRFVYDSDIPMDFLKTLMKKSSISSNDTLIPGGRYHNFKDFMTFPAVGQQSLRYEPMPPLAHPDFRSASSLFTAIKKKDILLHYPYQSFDYVIDLLREASIDPQVTSIKINLYRVGGNSHVIRSLINAVRNGKSVTVVIELQARFDEEANIYWTDSLREDGARIIHGVPNLKVHSKLCLITRKENGVPVLYANVATGNYNETTARVYSDLSLFTADKRITAEVAKIFTFFDNNYKTGTYSHLCVSPFDIRKKMSALIKNEIKNAREGKEAYMILKMNSLVDLKMIKKLYKASSEGVKIRLIVRGICSLIPGVKGLSENIEVVSILDRFLEHSRVFVFCNDGDEKYFISSADWMTRNLDRRVEVTCPIYDDSIKRELRDFLDIQLRDNIKARIINTDQDNCYKREPGKPAVRAQVDYYRYLEKRLSNPESRDMI